MIAGSYDENILSPAPNTKGQGRREQGRKRRRKRKNADFLLPSEEKGHCQDHGSSSTFHPRATKHRPKDPDTKGQGCREPDRERGRKRKRSGTGDAQNQTARPESSTRAEPCAIPTAPDPKVQCQRPEIFSQDRQDVSLEDQSTCHLGSEEPMSDDMAPNLASLEELYFKGALLGKGGYGSVYMGTRISDGLPVAIKYVAKTEGDSGVLPVEVALMKQVNMAPRCPYILNMLDWFDHPMRYVMVLERPTPCKDLLDFLEDSEGTLPEWLARKVMVQLVQALDHCQKQGVLHRDVKPDNILIQTDSHQVKLFDFGCGDVWKDTAYKDFAGTPDYTAPEWSFMREYLAGPVTVWSVGITLFILVCGSFPFATSLEAIRGRVAFPAGVSQECRDLIRWCLRINPSDRLTLEQIQLHPWILEGAMQGQSG